MTELIVVITGIIICCGIACIIASHMPPTMIQIAIQMHHQATIDYIRDTQKIIDNLHKQEE